MSTDLRACAEFLRTEPIYGPTGIREDWIDKARELARAVLSDVPADVQAAMERLRKYFAGKEPYKDGRQVFDDQFIVANHFLAHPIRLEATDREQLLAETRDSTTVPQCIECHRVIGDRHRSDCSFRNESNPFVTDYHCCDLHARKPDGGNDANDSI